MPRVHSVLGVCSSLCDFIYYYFAFSKPTDFNGKLFDRFLYSVAHSGFLTVVD